MLLPPNSKWPSIFVVYGICKSLNFVLISILKCPNLLELGLYMEDDFILSIKKGKGTVVPWGFPHFSRKYLLLTSPAVKKNLERSCHKPEMEMWRWTAFKVNVVPQSFYFEGKLSECVAAMPKRFTISLRLYDCIYRQMHSIQSLYCVNMRSA